MIKDQSSRQSIGPRINVTEAYDVRWWADRFGCTPQAIKDAVSAVGNVSIVVQAYLLSPRPAQSDRAALEAAFSPER